MRRTARTLTESLILFAMLVLLYGLLGGRTAWGKGIPFASLPTAQPYPTLSGLVFPPMNGAAAVNPAALPASGPYAAFQGAFTPPLQSGDSTGFFGSLALANRMVGLGAGVDVATGSGRSSTGLFTGLGIDAGPLALGVGMSDLNLDNGFSPSLDIGTLIGTGTGINFGAVFYDINHSAQLGVGLGYAHENKFTIEGDVLLPPFDNMSAAYTLIGAATLYYDIFGFYFRTAYLTSPSDFSHTIGALVWVTPRVNVIVQFVTSRTLSFGLTALF